MDYTELIAKQGILAEIYNRQRRDYKNKKAREEKARAKALRQIKKLANKPLIQDNKIG